MNVLTDAERAELANALVRQFRRYRAAGVDEEEALRNVIARALPSGTARPKEHRGECEWCGAIRCYDSEVGKCCTQCAHATYRDVEPV